MAIMDKDVIDNVQENDKDTIIDYIRNNPNCTSDDNSLTTK